MGRGVVSESLLDALLNDQKTSAGNRPLSFIVAGTSTEALNHVVDFARGNEISTTIVTHRMDPQLPGRRVVISADTTSYLVGELERADEGRLLVFWDEAAETTRAFYRATAAGLVVRDLCDAATQMGSLPEDSNEETSMAHYTKEQLDDMATDADQIPALEAICDSYDIDPEAYDEWDDVITLILNAQSATEAQAADDEDTAFTSELLADAGIEVVADNGTPGTEDGAWVETSPQPAPTVKRGGKYTPEELDALSKENLEEIGKAQVPPVVPMVGDGKGGLRPADRPRHTTWKRAILAYQEAQESGATPIEAENVAELVSAAVEATEDEGIDVEALIEAAVDIAVAKCFEVFTKAMSHALGPIGSQLNDLSEAVNKLQPPEPVKVSKKMPAPRLAAPSKG